MPWRQDVGDEHDFIQGGTREVITGTKRERLRSREGRSEGGVEDPGPREPASED